MDTIRFHSILARIGLMVALLMGTVGAVFVMRYSRGHVVPPDGDVFAVVDGTWAWTGSDSACVTEWHTISFSPGRDSMFIANSSPFEGVDGRFDSITAYVIQEHTRSRIRAAIPGETRLTAAGEPVVWDLVLRSPDSYAWRRTDLLPWHFTRRIVRCEGDELE